MKTAAETAGFIADLAIEHDAAAAFASLLAAEQDALRAGAAERLETLAREKMQMASRLEELAQRRTRYLAAAGFSPDAPGMHAWLASRAQAPGVTGAWQGLQRLAALARALNQANGVLIDLHLRHHQQRLAALNHACGAPGLYGPAGQPLPRAFARPLTAV